MIFPSSIIKFLRQYFRAIRIWRSVIILLFFLWVDSQKWTYIRGGGFSQVKENIRQQSRAKWLAKELLKLGSAFIKLGQLISARPDILPRSWVLELAGLQDQVPAFSFVKVQEILEKEYCLNERLTKELIQASILIVAPFSLPMAVGTFLKSIPRARSACQK